MKKALARVLRSIMEHDASPRTVPLHRALRISARALDAAGPPAREEPLSFLTLHRPAPPPRSAPETAKLAMDEAWGEVTNAARLGDYAFPAEGIGFLGYPYLAELAQRAEYRRISETMAKEMTRKWIKFSAVGKSKKQDKVDAIKAAFKRFAVQSKFRKMVELDGFFGRAQLYIDTGHTDNAEELRVPLSIDKVKIGKGGLKRLGVIEPVWSYPNRYNSTNPLREDFFRPETWFVQGVEVHRTRLLTFVSREVPDLLKPAFAFGGLSMSQMAKPYVDNWLRTRQSVSDLLHSFSTNGIKTDMSQVLDGGSADDVFKRADFFNRTRDNRGLLLLDKESEEFFNVSTPLGTLDHLQAQSQEHMSSVSGIPLVKLLGITPSGLNASSDGEIRSFYDWIHAQQEQLFTDPLTTVLHLIMLNEWGEIDEDIVWEFVPLWQLDEAGQASVRKTQADIDVQYSDSGILGPEEVRERLASEEDGPYAGLDPDDVPEQPEDDESAKTLPDPAKGQEGKSGV